MKRIESLCFALFFLGAIPLPGQSSEVSYFTKGSNLFFENLDSSIYYFHLSVPYYQSREDWDTLVNSYNALASCYTLKGDFSNSYEYAHQAMEVAKVRLPEDEIAYGAALNNLAVFAMNKGDYPKAIKLLQQNLLIEQQKGAITDQVSSLNSLGICYSKKGDILESKKYYTKAINLGLKELGSSEINITHSYNSLASIYIKTEQLDTALLLYQNSLDLIEKSSTKDVRINGQRKLTVHLRMAQIFLKQKKEQQFLHHIKKATHYSRLAFNKESEDVYSLLGQWARAQKGYQKAIEYGQKALALSKKKHSTPGKYPAVGNAYYNLANSYAQKGAIQQSLIHYQSALEQYAKKFSPTALPQNPSSLDLTINPDLIKILRKKAEAQFKSYLQSKDLKVLQTSKSTYLLAIQTLNQLRQSFLDTGSKEILAINVLPIFEGALKVLFTLYESTKNPTLLDEAFQIAENSKAVLLLESINASDALGVAGIPDSLLQQEQALKQDIAYYKKQLVETPFSKKEKIKTIEEGLFSLEKKHRDLIEVFESNYPDYHRLKYNTKLADIEAVQKKLASPQSALIEYFVGTASLYIFVVTKNQAHWYQLQKPLDFEESIQRMRKLLIHPPQPQQAQEDFTSFTGLAHQLYQLLIRSVELKGIKQLYLIPDDLLAYLPFEILLQQKPNPHSLNYSIHHLDYLLKDYQISYNYSATLLCRENQLTLQASKNFIGFAPDFSLNNPHITNYRNFEQDELLPLTCNRMEVEQISAIFNGTSLIDEAAGKENFLNNIQDYRIVHFATHSYLDDENPMLNKIFFNDDYLSNYDLYNLQIPAELSVLSACNTGNGQLHRGEGVMSLSRGFMHAGCPSVLMSLWSVEDCKTSKIMTYYYQGIKAGKCKDLALQKAKIHYLENTNKLTAHPFYWAPFIQFGEIKPMVFSGSQRKWWWGALLLAGVLFFFWRIK